MALRELLGQGASLSASSLQRLKEKWQGEYEQWRSAAIEEKDWAYLWADGIYVKAGIGKEKAALLVVIGVRENGTKRFLALEPGYRESKSRGRGSSETSSGAGLRVPGYLSAMGTWDYGRRWEKFIPKPRSSFAGITRCSM